MNYTIDRTYEDRAKAWKRLPKLTKNEIKLMFNSDIDDIVSENKPIKTSDGEECYFPSYCMSLLAHLFGTENIYGEKPIIINNKRFIGKNFI